MISISLYFEIHIAAESLSPRAAPKIAQSREKGIPQRRYPTLSRFVALFPLTLLASAQLTTGVIMSRYLLLILMLSSAPIIHALDNPSRPSGRPPTNCLPRLSNKLHLGQFFLNSQSSIVATQEKLFSNLIQNVYGSQPIFHKNAKDPSNMLGLTNLFARIRKEIRNLSADYRMHRVSDLGNIDVGDRSLQFIFFLILEGGSGDLAGSCRLTPLSQYTTLKKRNTCVDLYLASKPILLALFGDENVVYDLMQYRQNVFTQLRDGKILDIDVAERNFRDQFEGKMISGIDPRTISFRVSAQYSPESK